MFQWNNERQRKKWSPRTNSFAELPTACKAELAVMSWRWNLSSCMKLLETPTKQPKARIDVKMAKRFMGRKTSHFRWNFYCFSIYVNINMAWNQTHVWLYFKKLRGFVILIWKMLSIFQRVSFFYKIEVIKKWILHRLRQNFFTIRIRYLFPAGAFLSFLNVEQIGS